MHCIKFIDLFCGLGAFHYVLRKYNGKCVFACDIDEGVRNIYHKNYHIMPHGDINNIDVNNIPEHDLLCAGFPCQSFSIAGKKEGFNDKTKGNLFFRILDIIDAKLPQIVILENVKNIITINNGNILKRIVSELEQREYKVSFKIMNSVYYGSPQCRERVFIVALQGKENFMFPNDDKTNIKVVRDIIDTHQAIISNNIMQKYKIEKIESKSKEYKPKMIYKLINKKTEKGGRQGERVYDISHPGATICASSGGPGSKTGLYLIDDTVRRLNVKECLKMFGFPDDYIFDVDENKMLFYLGNSIVTNVIDAIINKLAITSMNQL
jgi:DNA (cytosine-5)-methyltransferase 1